MVDFKNFGKAKVPDVKWTQEQQAVIDADKPVIGVQSVAGSGKSTVLQAIAAKHKHGLYLAFNKSVVKAMTPKLAHSWECKTFHSYGLQTLRANGWKGAIDFRKYSKDKAGIGKIVSYMKTHGIGFSSHNIGTTAERMGVDLFDRENIIDRIKELLSITRVIDADDMLWLPLQEAYHPKKHYDIVLIDEAVDMNVLQLNFIQLINTDRIVFMYDRYQNIYGFNGAVHDLESYLGSSSANIDRYYDAHFMSLDNTFRCPQRIVREINHLVPQMVSHIPGGYVETKSINSPDFYFARECLIIGRFNFDLMVAVIYLLEHKKQFSVKKRFIDAIQSRCKKLYEEEQDFHTAREALSTHIGQLEQMQLKGSQRDLLYNMQALHVLMKRCSDWHAVMQVVTRLKQSVTENHPIQLMSIHSAKGLEHNMVYLVGKNHMDKFRNNVLENGTQYEYAQEENLLYVACTRSLNHLVYVNV